jgi:hypothetical protein
MKDLAFHYNDLINRYEDLRSFVLENSGFNGKPDMGYVLFLRRGMLVWMENCSTSLLSPVVKEFSKIHDGKEIPDYLRRQLVFALTNIAINHQRKAYGRT